MTFLIIAIIAAIIIVAFQINKFRATRRDIDNLNDFFPDLDDISLQESTINRNALNDRRLLRDIALNPPGKKAAADMTADDTNVSLIRVDDGSEEFRDMIAETNEYLCKNAGTSADLSVLQDICERKLQIIDNSARSTLNLPLFIGLAGTFVGIIIGVVGFAMDLGAMFGSNASMEQTDGLKYLLYGIGCAMCASLAGLIMTVYNTAFTYKEATADVDEERNEYFDFLRRELMPTLSNSMTSSLNSLKGVLGHFVDRFGTNLDAYADSAALLNDNLEKQHLVLARIQEMGVTRMANKVASAFVQLNDAADSLTVFRQYQQSLNGTIQQVQGAVAGIDTLITKFDNFIGALASVAGAQSVAIDLQQQFKAAIETHFPTGAEGRTLWRKEFDLLINDAQQATGQLNSQLAQNTAYIKQFITDNDRFFASFDEMRTVLQSLVDYARVQGECYRDLKDEMLALRKDSKDAQKETAELHRTMLDAVKAMTKVVKERYNH